MINYIEKGIEMHDALAHAGLSLYQADGEWVTDSDPAEVQAFIDSYVQPHDTQISAINEQCSALLASVKLGIPDGEVLSWTKQETEARAGGGPLTTALAVARGIPLDILLEKIIQKADDYATFSGSVIGLRQSLEDRIIAGEEGVTWPASPI